MKSKLFCVFVFLTVCLSLFAMLPQAKATVTSSSWLQEITGLPITPYHVGVDSEGRIFIIKFSTPYQVWRSIDRGVSWIKVLENTTSIQHIFVDSRDYIYVYDADVWRSTDHGDTFTKILDTTGISQMWHMDEDSNGRIYLNSYDSTAGNDYIYRSDINGTIFSVWYNITDIRHIHSVDVDPTTNYVFVTTGDNAFVGATSDNADDSRIIRWNGTDWEVLAQSTEWKSAAIYGYPYDEERSTSMFFIGNYAFTQPDGAVYSYRFPITGTWAQREKVFYHSLSDLDVNTEGFWSAEVGDIVFTEDGTGKLFGTWDGVHYVKLMEGATTEHCALMQGRKGNVNFPFYFVSGDYKLYRIGCLTREDLVQLYYGYYTPQKGLLTNEDNFVYEQRVMNGTNYLDLTKVALTNVQASIKGLSKRGLTNPSFETGNTSGWTILYGASNLSVTNSESYNGNYSLKAQKATTDTYETHIYQNRTMEKGDNFLIVSWFWKSNASVALALQVTMINQSSGAELKSGWFTSDTDWTERSLVLVSNTTSSWIMKLTFVFKKVAVTTYLDSVVALSPEVGIARKYPNEDASYNFQFVNQTYFENNVNTFNPSLVVSSQTVSYSGELTNGTESEATSLIGTLTGAVKVDANIEGSGQAILRLTGTRIFTTSSVILKDYENGWYYGRYYGTPTYPTELCALTNLQANITSISYASNKLTLTIDSPSETTSTTKVYCGDKGEPISISGATTSSYDSATKILTITVLHSSEETVTVSWGNVSGGIRDAAVVVAEVLSIGLLLSLIYIVESEEEMKKKLTICVGIVFVLVVILAIALVVNSMGG